MATNSNLELIRELKKRSNLGMSICKTALENAQWDIEKAYNELRKQNLIKISDHYMTPTTPTIGTIKTYENNYAISIVRTICDTEAHAKSAVFQDLTSTITKELINHPDVSIDAFMSYTLSSDPYTTISDLITQHQASHNESIVIDKILVINKQPRCSYGIYTHQDGSVMGYIEIIGLDNNRKIRNELAMHIASENPEFLDVTDVPTKIVEVERDIFKTQLKDSKQPQHVIDNLVSEKIKKFFATICLKQQDYIHEPKKTVSQYIEELSHKTNTAIIIKSFDRWQ